MIQHTQQADHVMGVDGNTSTWQRQHTPSSLFVVFAAGSHCHLCFRVCCLACYDVLYCAVCHRRSPTPPEVRLQRERERELAELERATRTVFAFNINIKANEKDIFEFFCRAGEVRPGYRTRPYWPGARHGVSQCLGLAVALYSDTLCTFCNLCTVIVEVT